MLNTFTLDTFRPHVGEPFRVRFGDASDVSLTLTAAMPLAMDTDPRRVREPFHLVFRGPPGRGAPQGIYQLQHDVLGEMGIFITPVSATPEGVEYEAIFT